MSKKIIIVGSGNAALSAGIASLEKGAEVTIYEKDTIPGGMARTFRYPNGVPTEHSWRGYGPFYYNFLDIAKQIPVSTIEHFQANKIVHRDYLKHFFVFLLF